MDLYIIRHAEAVPLGEQGITEDAARPLTPRGVEQAHVLADAFQRKHVHVTAVVTSPLVRARQTADEFVRSWPAPAPAVHVCEHLAPGGRRRKLARALRELGGESVALVGHEPDLGWLTAWLIGSTNAQVTFAKGGAAYLRCEDQVGKESCTLVWLLTPAWLS